MSPGTTVVYISMQPGSVPNGRTIFIGDTRTGVTISTAFLDGGFDPVAIGASAGDTLTFVLETTDSTSETYTRAVPGNGPPIVVRTSPPVHKRDVPLNARLLIVFSEPVDSMTLRGASIQLMHGSSSVPGSAYLLDPVGVRAEFKADGLLAVNTDYTLVITQSVRDVSGSALDSVVSVTFTTSAPEILIDASLDGGAWWGPQNLNQATPSLPHQGQPLADDLRSRGYHVDELAGGTYITPELLAPYVMIIRAGVFDFGNGGYDSTEIAAYQGWVRAGGKLLLLNDIMKFSSGPIDRLGMSFGLVYAGVTTGNNLLVTCDCDAVTAGADPMYYGYYGVGSGLIAYPDSATIDGWVDQGTYLDRNNDKEQEHDEPSAVAVMGTMRFGKGKIVFSGDVNMWEWLPEPLLTNVLAWLKAP